MHAPHAKEKRPPHEREDVRPTDLAADEARIDDRAVSTGFAPGTGARLKRAGLIAAAILLLAFVAVSLDRYFKARGVARDTLASAGAAPLVDVIEAKPVGSTQHMELPGYTAAWHASTIYARVNGYVGRWFVDIGDHVRSGEVLASIETPELDAQLAAAHAQLKASQAQVLVRRAEAEFSRTTYERWRDSPKGVVSEQEREEKKADYGSAEARLKSAEADLTLAEARVNQYQALTAFKQVTAPYDGVVTVRDIDIGNLVTAGSTSATTPLYVMSQNDPMRIFVDAPQSVASDLINSSLPVQIQTGGGVAREYSGRVTRTSNAINPQARTLRVEVDIPNPKDEFVPGMYVKVGFGLPARGLVEVPAAALVFRASGPQVAIVDRSDRVHFRDVTIGRDDGSMVELSKGVAAGDRLALNISSQIADGERVQTQNAAGGAAATHHG